MKLKILDCTLRDGGYVNNWGFEKKCQDGVINKLISAEIDVIEVGFLDKSSDRNINSTLFSSVQSIEAMLENFGGNHNSEFAAMIMHGKFDAESLPVYNNGMLKIIRYCFKKNYIDEALEICKIIQKKGYDVYLQPASVTDYLDEDMLELIKKVNRMDVSAFYIVDTFGIMTKYDLMRFFYLIDNNLVKNIPVGFHSHNNLQLSFSNAQELIELNPQREIFIDTSVLGIGRGAGNLCTELMIKYVNENIGTEYNIVPIIEAMDEYIMPIYSKSPWGYSAPYYIAAINNCHPNYATFLMNKQSLFVKDINNLIKTIPIEKKHVYDEKYISNLYAEYLSHSIDDSKTTEELSKLCSGRKILVIAPGKSIADYKAEIDEFISENDPVVFSINHIPSFFNVDVIFVSNLKRFRSIDDVIGNFGGKVICTSNIAAEMNTAGINISKVNYSDYLNNESIVLDNAGLMLINILNKIGIKHIALAGFDGFDYAGIKNYYDYKMINSIDSENKMAMNKAIKDYFKKLKKTISVDFVTPTIYDCYD